MSAFAASIMVIGVGLSQVTAADLVPLRPHIERIADQEPALIVDALAAGIQALPNAATRNAFADAFAKTAGLDRIDLTADPAFQRDVEVVRAIVKRWAQNPDESMQALKAEIVLKEPKK